MSTKKILFLYNILFTGIPTGRSCRAEKHKNFHERVRILQNDPTSRSYGKIRCLSRDDNFLKRT